MNKIDKINKTFTELKSVKLQVSQPLLFIKFSG